jgi:hypothetical protein
MPSIFGAFSSLGLLVVDYVTNLYNLLQLYYLILLYT